MSPYHWTMGTTTMAGYANNGDDNERLIELNPFGQEDVIWTVTDDDTTSTADGGWNGVTLNIDNLKMYRYSVWVKREVLGNGHFYFGCRCFDVSGSTLTIRYTHAETGTTNPYFETNVNFGEWGNVGDWYLVVAHVWPYGTPVTSKHPDSGVYDVNGNRIYEITYDFVWPLGAEKTAHRSYLYYSTIVGTKQAWYSPRLDVCDGTEPDIHNLIHHTNNNKDLISGIDINNYGATRNVGNGCYEFDGTNHIRFDTPYTELTEGTWEVWFKGVRANTSDHGYILHCGNTTSVGDSHITTGFDADGRTYGCFDGAWVAMNSMVYESADEVRCLTVTWDGSNQHFYINGQLQLSNALTALTYGINARTSIGCDDNNVTRPVVGTVYSTRSYTKALTEQEVRNNYIAARSKFS